MSKKANLTELLAESGASAPSPSGRHPPTGEGIQHDIARRRRAGRARSPITVHFPKQVRDQLKITRRAE